MKPDMHAIAATLAKQTHPWRAWKPGWLYTNGTRHMSAHELAKRIKRGERTNAGLE